MKISAFFIFFAAALINLANTAQAQYNWVATPLPNAPTRFDDMFWRNPNLGFVIDYYGDLNKSADGGQTWQSMPTPPGKYFRSMAWLTDQVGFIGKLAPSVETPADTFTLYRTQNGGNTWAPIPIPAIPSSDQGFCGMSAVNDTVLYAVGRFANKPYVHKTTDGGNTWTTINMLPQAGGLVDCYFWTPDSGMVVGHNGANWDSGSAIILFTSNGGQTWQNKYTSPRTPELCWKISFPSENIGYVSIENDGTGATYVLKTTDKGQTWQELLLSPTQVYIQGIGFLNDSIGWAGGGMSNSAYQTTDGGQTWNPITLGSNLNRFRFFGDSLGYVSGQQVHKLDINLMAAQAQPANQLQQATLSQPSPNPANQFSSVWISMPAPGYARLSLNDALGREVRVIQERTHLPVGEQQLQIPVKGLAPGVYLLQLTTPQFVQSRRLVIGH